MRLTLAIILAAGLASAVTVPVSDNLASNVLVITGIDPAGTNTPAFRQWARERLREAAAKEREWAVGRIRETKKQQAEEAAVAAEAGIPEVGEP